MKVFWGEMFVGLVTRATWRSPIQASGSKRCDIKHYNTNNGVKRGWHNTSYTIRYKTIEHEHWGPKRLTQRPISDEWEKTQSVTVGVCISRRTVRLKKQKGCIQIYAQRKILHQNDDLWNCPTFLHLCLSVHSQWKWLYHNSPQCRVTIDNLVDSHFGVQYPQLVLGVSQISKWFLSLAYIQQFR